MSQEEQNRLPEDPDDETPFDAEDELDDEDLENVAGGWSGNDGGGG